MESNEIMHDFVFLTHWYDVIKAYDDAGQHDVAGAIAKEIITYGVTEQTTTDNPFISSLVKGMCQRAGIHINKGGRPKKYSVNDILLLRDQGLSFQDIADKLGCSAKTVQRKLAQIDTVDEI